MSVAVTPHIDSFSILEGKKRPQTIDEAVSSFISSFTTQMMEAAVEHGGDGDEEDSFTAEQPGDNLVGKFFAMAAGDAIAKDPKMFQAYRAQLSDHFAKSFPQKDVPSTDLKV